MLIYKKAFNTQILKVIFPKHSKVWCFVKNGSVHHLRKLWVLVSQISHIASIDRTYDPMIQLTCSLTELCVDHKFHEDHVMSFKSIIFYIFLFCNGWILIKSRGDALSCDFKIVTLLCLKQFRINSNFPNTLGYWPQTLLPFLKGNFHS